MDNSDFIRVVVAKAEEMGVPISVALVNAEGHLLIVERMDHAGFITPEIAWSKAHTVAAFRSMSPRFPDGMVIQQWFKERNPQMMVNMSNFTNGRIVASGGCAPIFDGDDMIGCYGISGGTSQQDEIMGRHARELLGWPHTAEHDDTPEDVKEHIKQIYAQVGLSAK